MNNYSLEVNMLTRNAEKAVRFMLRNMEKVGCNINQMARFVDISVGSAFNTLKSLEKNKIVNAEKIGNAVYYKLNLDNTEAKKICELLLLEEKRQLKGYAKLYGQALQAFDKAELIILFGSVLTKKEFNDVDVLFVTKKVREVNKYCLEVSRIRTRPVVPLILKKEDLINEIKNERPAILSAIKEGIVLRGEAVFVEVIKLATA